MGCGGSRAPPAHESRGHLTAVPGLAGHGPLGGPTSRLLLVALSTVASRRPRPHRIRPRTLQPRPLPPRAQTPPSWLRPPPAETRPGVSSSRLAVGLAPERLLNRLSPEFSCGVPLHCEVRQHCCGLPLGQAGVEGAGLAGVGRDFPTSVPGRGKNEKRLTCHLQLRCPETCLGRYCPCKQIEWQAAGEEKNSASSRNQLSPCSGLVGGKEGMGVSQLTVKAASRLRRPRAYFRPGGN